MTKIGYSDDFFRKGSKAFDLLSLQCTCSDKTPCWEHPQTHNFQITAYRKDVGFLAFLTFFFKRNVSTGIRPASHHSFKHFPVMDSKLFVRINHFLHVVNVCQPQWYHVSCESKKNATRKDRQSMGFHFTALSKVFYIYLYGTLDAYP